MQRGIRFFILALMIFSLTMCNKMPAGYEEYRQEMEAKYTPTEEPEPTPSQEPSESDNSVLIGLWVTENGNTDLWVKSTGAYEMNYSDEAVTGTIAAIEDSNQRWNLIGENGKPWNNAVIAFDASHPEALTLEIGMGAELLYYSENQTSPVHVGLNETDSSVPDLIEVNLSESDNAQLFLITTSETVYNFRVLELSDLAVQATGAASAVTKEVYKVNDLTKTDGLQVKAEPGPENSGLGYSYEDQDGNVYSWMISVDHNALETKPFQQK